MATTFTKKILSGSTDGKAVKVAATATAGTTIHTGSATATTIDEVWLYAVNSSASSVKLTIEWGEATAPDGNIELTVTAESGLVLLIPGLLIKGNATPLVVKAFAGTANVICLHGYVNQITVQVFVPRPHAPRTRVSTYLSDWMPLGDVTRQSVAGYIAGGSDSGGRISRINKLAFPAETISTPSATLTAIRNDLAGFANSGVAGYVGGGAPATNIIDKITFPADTKTTLSATLTTGRQWLSATSNFGVAGYFGGGYDSGTYVSGIDKVSFPTDTKSTLTDPLTSVVITLGAMADNGVAGYFGGGVAAAAKFSRVDRLSFSADTISTGTITLSSGTTTPTGFADSGVAGYFAGGEDSGGKLDRINRIAFPAETRSTLSAVLSTATINSSGFADCGVF